MRRFILSLDAGTSSTRAVLFQMDGLVAASAQKSIRTSYPQAGWVEQDGDDIWASTLSVAVEVMSRHGVSASDIAAIGIANQRETTVLWDRMSGQPVAPAIVWQCRRTADICEQLRAEGLEETIQERTGLVLDPYFSATKIMWLLDQSPSLRARAERGDILFGTVESWLIYKLTGGRVHVTDVTNASRTQLFNIHTRTWDELILKQLNIPSIMLPTVVPSASLIAETEPSFFGSPLPIAAAIGDQQSALIGHGGVNVGDAKCTFGTGCFLLMNTGSVPVQSKHGLLTTIAYGTEETTRYALEGSVFTAGQAITWLKDSLGFLKDEASSDQMAREVPDSDGVFMVPAFTGLGTPYWNANARGILTGLTAGTRPAHIVRATIESLAYQTIDVLAAMKQDSGLAIASLHVDGGAARNDLLLETLANLHNDAVLRPHDVEATAKGAALLAGITLGFYTAKSLPLEGHTQRFLPQMNATMRKAMLASWQRAVEASLHFGHH